MKGVNTEGTNTEAMQKHMLTKKARGAATSMRHEEVDLMVCTDLIDRSRTLALNGSSNHASVLDVLGANPEDKPLASDVDPQLIIKVFFKAKVNLSSIALRFNKPPTPNGDEDETEDTYSKPRLIKVFGNMDNLDFSDMDEAIPAATHIVEDAEAEELKIACVGHKFQRLESVQILIEEAQSPDALRTFLNRVRVAGHQHETYD